MPGRTLYAHLIPWRTPARVVTRDGASYAEWFQRTAVRLPPWPNRVPLTVEHGGTRIGWLFKLVDYPATLDGVFQVDAGEAGDAALSAIPPDGGRLPISIGFQPISAVEYPEGIMRTRVELTEIAITENATYEAAFIYARGNLPPADPRRDWAA